AAGLEDRRPGIRSDAAREAADTVRDGGSVAGHDVDVLEANADRVGGDLRERRLIALTLRRRAARHHDAPTRVESQDGAREGTETHAPHADGDADSGVTAVLPEARLLAPRLVVVRALERAPKQLGIVPAVVGERRGIAEPHADRVRKRIGRNEVLEANRRGI